MTLESDDSHSDEPTAETVEHNAARECAEAIEAAGPERSTNQAEHSERDGVRVPGIDVESPDLVATAVVMPLLLAALVWRRPTRRLLLLIAVAAAALAIHQTTTAATVREPAPS